MRSYIKIYRPMNIFFIGASQLFCAYYLDRFASLSTLLNTRFYWVSIGTIACASFGYWINAFFDKERDLINNKQSYLHFLPKGLVILHLIFFALIGLVSGYYLEIRFLLLNILTLFILLIYSWRLKDFLFVGNIFIALLSFLSIYSISFISPSIDPFLLYHYSIFSGLIILCREIIKDAEDIEGDRATNSYTVPILIGIKKTNILVYIILLLSISLLIFSYYYQSFYFQGYLKYIFTSYIVLFVLIPLYKVTLDVKFAKNSLDYSKLSTILKYVIFTGILSVLFF